MRAWLLVLTAAAALAIVPRQAPSDREREAAWRANNVGVARLEQFDYDGAAQAFREALQIQPALAIARLNLAIALFYGGKAPEAAAEAQAAAERLSDVPQAHYIVGLIARAEDKPDVAASAFERVLKLDPADAGAKVNLGQIALQQRQYDRALPLFTEALAAEPYNVTAAYSLALALTRSGNTEEGRKAMERFESLRDSAYGVTYAQTYLSQGKYAEAIASTGAEPELVDPAPPEVTFSDASAEMLPAGKPTGATHGTVTLFDADGDGDLDLLDSSGTSLRFLRNTGKGFLDDTERAGLRSRDGTTGMGAAAGDYDNDGRPDLLVLGVGGHRLYRQNEKGAFAEVAGFHLKAEATKVLGEAPKGVAETANRTTAAALADFDHDGDLDILIAGSPTQLLRNNGNGSFADIAVQAAVSAPLRATAVVAIDYDNRRDTDILATTSDRGIVLYRNLRDGSFRDVAAEAGLPVAGSFSALAAGDVNKDGFVDFFFGRADGPGLFALSDGQTRFRMEPAPDGTSGALAAQFVDYDNDGLLDLLTGAADRLALLRNIGGGRWSDVSAGRLFPDAGLKDLQTIALGDLDGDGDTDAALRTADGGLRVWRNEGGNRRPSLRVRLTARVSNRSAIGARVEVRAGSLRQQHVTTSSTPAVAPADVIFGLGPREGADVIRVLWPSGILQAETGPASAPLKPGVMEVTELDRKPSSCPYLFTWNGTAFEFVTDFLGGGEMGAWLAPGVWNTPDPDEYVRIGREQLRARGGRYELRITNELEEALFVDRVQLVAVDHPSALAVFPNEGLRSAPRPPFHLTAVRGARPPLRAFDGHGHDVLARIASVDRRYPDDFALLPIRGYAEPHSLTLQLPPDAEDAVLLMTGWTDYAFSNDNVAASQLGVTMVPPSLEVRDRSGAWKTVHAEIGFPVGRPQTVVVPLKGKWLSAARDVRVRTNMRIYWDQILVATSSSEPPVRLTRLDPASADLRWRGFSAEQTPDGREPYGYDYARVSTTTPWKVMVGGYTREGDVQGLLREVDDMYVISRPGDELAVTFDEGSLPPLSEGWTRTFLLYAHGWSKEMNPRSASPDAVGPLPFFRMSGYPYGPGEHYPRTDLHREYQQKYNTRVVRRPVPSIDALIQ